MQLGMVGLGRMGSGMTRRLEATRPGGRTYDPNVALDGEDARALKKQLEPPRHVWMMVPPARPPRTRSRSSWHPRARRHDHRRRQLELPRLAAALKEARKQKISFVDVGVSGGIWGLEVGFCLMVGGDKAPMKRLDAVFEALAPEDGYAHVGPSGAGHFVKMVHNGIEYGLMQAYAEGFEIMDDSEFDLDLQRDRRHLALRLGRPLVAARAPARRLRAARRQLDDIAPFVEDSGEGRWTINEAINENVPAPGDQRLALRALRLAPGDRLLGQGAGRAAQPVRRPRGQGRQEAKAGRDP